MGHLAAFETGIVSIPSHIITSENGLAPRMVQFVQGPKAISEHST